MKTAPHFPLPGFHSMRDSELKPRVHPNGFIQVDINSVFRMHVWHPSLPYRQKTYHPIHDHIFGFQSHVYSGRLIHVPYLIEEDPEGTHIFWQATHIVGTEKCILKQVDGKCLRLVGELAKAVQPGEDYYFAPFLFHETLSNEPTMTIIKKNAETFGQGSTQAPRIAVPVGVEPDNDFQRDDVDTDILWDLIKEAHPWLG